MTAKDLKASILQLAIQGKLVPQDSTDEPASALLARIRDSRVEVENGRATSMKSPRGRGTRPACPPITDDEKPFDLPEGWEWCRLGEISENVGARENQILAKEIKKVGAIPVVSQGQSYIDGYCDDLSKAITDVPVVMFGDHTKNVKYIDFPFVIGADGTKFFKSQVDTKWLYYWTLFQSTQIGDRGYGRHWGLLNKQIVALPPLAEQKRIVAKIEELMPMVERYGAVKEQSDALEAALPDAFRKSVLQYAIQGKLVPQDPNDEPASALLERICKSRVEVEKCRKGRSKLPPAPQPIPEDEQPFNLPEGWVWVRLGDVGVTQTGSTPSTQVEEYKGADIPFIKPADIYDDHIDYDNQSLSQLGAEAGRTVVDSSVLMVCIGSIGKCFYTDRTVAFNQQINAITPCKVCACDYLLLAMQSPYFFGEAWSRSSKTTLSILNKSTWASIPIPLPPLAEQKRIVAEVERLLALGEHLKIAS